MKKEKETRPIVVNDDDSTPSGFGIGKDKLDELNKKPFSFITKAFKFIKFKLKNWKETRLVNKFEKLSPEEQKNLYKKHASFIKECNEKLHEIYLNGSNNNKNFVKILKLKKEKFHLLNKFGKKSTCFFDYFDEDIERRNSDPVIANIRKLEPLGGNYEGIKEFLVNKSEECKDN